jgi:hypothetical protein
MRVSVLLVLSQPVHPSPSQTVSQPRAAALQRTLRSRPGALPHSLPRPRPGRLFKGQFDAVGGQGGKLTMRECVTRAATSVRQSRQRPKVAIF